MKEVSNETDPLEVHDVSVDGSYIVTTGITDRDAFSDEGTFPAQLIGW